MIFDTIAALADYLNNGKFDNSASREQCEAVISELLRTDHETLTVDGRVILNNELDRLSYFAENMQHRTPRSEYEREVSNLESSSSASSSSSLTLSGPLYPEDLVFLNVSNGALVERASNIYFSLVSPSTLQTSYVSNLTSGGGIASGDSILLSSKQITFGLWAKGFVNSNSTILSFSSQDFFGNLSVGMEIMKDNPLGITASHVAFTGLNYDEWNFFVASYDPFTTGYRYGHNGEWYWPESFEPSSYWLSQNITIPLDNFLYFNGAGSFTGLFITESYPDWDVLREYALASKPADAVMW